MRSAAFSLFEILIKCLNLSVPYVFVKVINLCKNILKTKVFSFLKIMLSLHKKYGPQTILSLTPTPVILYTVLMKIY